MKSIKEGVLIEKRLVTPTGGDSLPRVRLEIVSKRDTRTRIRFREDLPSSLSAEEVVPDSDGRMKLSVGGPHSIVFEALLEPRGEYVTEYRFHEPVTDLNGLLEPPRIESVDELDPGELEAGEGRSDTAPETEAEGEAAGDPASRGLSTLRNLLAGDRAGDGNPERGGTDSAGAGDRDGDADGSSAARAGGSRVTVSADGIAVSRELKSSRAGVVASVRIAKEAADDTRTVEVHDPLPGALDVEEIGFNPERPPASGRANASRVEFLAELAPSEDVRVEWGATLWRGLDSGALRETARRRPPRFEIAADVAGRPASSSRGGGSLAELFGVPVPDEDERSGVDVLREIAEAVDGGAVDYADLEPLRAALGVGEVPASLRARIENQERRTAEFSAYAEAMRAFIDRHGAATTAFDEVDGRLDDLTDELSALQDERRELSRAMRELAGEIDRVDSAAASRFERVRDRVDALEERRAADRADLEAAVEVLRDDIESVRAEVEDGRERWSKLMEALE